jgi:hypothetical protein
LDTFYAILIIVAFVVGVYVLRRAMGAGVNATYKVASQKLLYKSEYSQGMQMVSAPTAVSIPAPPNEILREVTDKVTTARPPLELKAAVYESSRTADRITYVFGSKLQPKYFEAEVRCVSRGATTDAVFSVLSWREKDGLIVGRETLEALRAQVLEGFTAAGADAARTAGLAVQHGPVPSVFVDTTGYKKYGFAAAGAALTLVAVVKFSIIGFYPNEALPYFGILVAGGVCFYLSSKMKPGEVGDNATARGKNGASAPVEPVPGAKMDALAPAVGVTQPTAVQTGQKTRFCTRCGSPLRAGSSFCASCGAQARR